MVSHGPENPKGEIMEYKRRHKEEMSERGIRRDHGPIGVELLRVDEPVTAVCIGRTSGGRRRATVAARTRKRLYLLNGMLDSTTGDETGRTQEDLEANAFAGLLLMPDQLLYEQILLYGLDKDLVTVASVLILMDMFAMPYKAVVLRLFEGGNISHQQAEKLLEVGSADVMERVSLTGKAKRWQLDGKGTESFGTLLEKVEYNRQHEYLTESRENEDVAYLAQLKKEYGLD